MRTKVMAVLAACCVIGAACSGGDDAPAARDDPESSEVAPCEPEEGESAARAVLRCGEPAVAFVETMYATGTGVAIEARGERYLLTNQHVVDPFDAADVVLDGETIADLPVVGADVAADIALLGPIDADGPVVAVGSAKGLERGDAVYLVGYPGEASSDDHEATIASGIVSRLRDSKDWGQRYIQTDANIAGGQSGGPLFAEGGALAGISGLAFAEEFALALSGEDVREAVDRILEDGGDDYLTVPASLPATGGATSGTVKIDNAAEGQALYLPPDDEERTLNLTVSGADSLVSVTVTDGLTGESLAVNAAAIPAEEAYVARVLAAGKPDPTEEFGPEYYPEVTDEMRARETAPGTFTIDIDAEAAVEVTMSARTDAPLDVQWTSDLELWPLSTPVTTDEFSVGESVDAIFNAYDTSYDYLVELDAGEEIEISASSPQGDMAVDVIPPGIAYDAIVATTDATNEGIEYLDDSDEGLYGYDVRETYTAETAGTYRLRVYSLDFATTAFRFAVTDEPADR